MHMPELLALGLWVCARQARQVGFELAYSPERRKNNARLDA